MAKNEDTKNISAEQQEQIDAYINEILANARAKAEAEAAKIIENAKKQAAPKAARKDPNGEMEVVYTFFKDDDQHSDDVFISVNGECVVCKRGEPVKIKRYLLDAYLLAEEQKKKAANRVSENEKRYLERNIMSGI